MDPIPVRDEDYQKLFDLQKSVQSARLDGQQETAEERLDALTASIHELYPETAGKKARFDVSGRKIFIRG